MASASSLGAKTGDLSAAAPRETPSVGLLEAVVERPESEILEENSVANSAPRLKAFNF